MAAVEVEMRGAVRHVLLNRPEKRNALNPAMIEALYEAFAKPPGKDERLAVLEAAGPVFSAGIDLKERDGSAGGIKPFERALHAMETYPLPVVGVVQGAAIAGGNELALHCDLVVASTAAKFGMSPAQIGLAPSWFLCKKLMEIAGPVATKRILLLGDPLPAQTFFAMGLISHIAEPDQLEATRDAIIDRLSRNAPMSLKAIKAVLTRQLTYRDHIAHEDLDKQLGIVRESEDAKEGIRALFERRQPKFEER
ncbi:MAG: enoyl-CoA hydratase/isomerase family protein [Alphaproteobacteria bacterium]|nr:enoyl-CoA hydratase/isomerase family protein [Alphaproteobacteria bacterium]